MTITKKKAGIAFTKYLDELRIRPAELARRLKVSPQDIANWKLRGVPSERSNEVAEMLGCEPHEISRVDRARLDTKGLTPLQRVLVSSTEGLNADAMAILIQHALDLVKEGRKSDKVYPS